MVTMQTAKQAISRLSQLKLRYDRLKQLFNGFQTHIEELAKDTFPVQGIKVTHESDTMSRVQLLDLDSKVAFSVTSKDRATKGKLSFLKINPFNDKDITEAKSVLFNGQGIVDIEPPKEEDPIDINGDNCSINIVLNWLCEELEK